MTKSKPKPKSKQNEKPKPKPKPKPQRFTFRRQPRERGLASIGRPWPPVDIKHDGMVVGCIMPPSSDANDQKWSVWVMKEDRGKVGWRWVKFRQRHESEAAAREWVQEFAELILDMGLYHWPKGW